MGLCKSESEWMCLFVLKDVIELYYIAFMMKLVHFPSEQTWLSICDQFRFWIAIKYHDMTPRNLLTFHFYFHLKRSRELAKCKRDEVTRRVEDKRPIWITYTLGLLLIKKLFIRINFHFSFHWVKDKDSYTYLGSCIWFIHTKFALEITIIVIISNGIREVAHSRRHNKNNLKLFFFTTFIFSRSSVFIPSLLSLLDNLNIWFHFLLWQKTNVISHVFKERSTEAIINIINSFLVA